MEYPEQLRDIVGGIVGSYESKVKVVTSLMREVNQRIRSFHIEQEQMTDRLQDILAKNECLRKKDFDAIMAGIRDRQKAREKKVSRMLKDFHREQEEVNTALRMLLEKGSSVRVKDLRAMVKAFHIDRKARNWSRPRAMR